MLLRIQSLPKSILGIALALFCMPVVTPGICWSADNAAVLPIENADAKTAAEMKFYTEIVERTDGKIEMLPIAGGEFMMGSPASEMGRQEDEGPQHLVKVSPFWMSKFEIPWEVYEVWMFDLENSEREF